MARREREPIPPLTRPERPGEELTAGQWLECCLEAHGVASSMRSIAANVAFVAMMAKERGLKTWKERAR